MSDDVLAAPEETIASLVDTIAALVDTIATLDHTVAGLNDTVAALNDTMVRNGYAAAPERNPDDSGRALGVGPNGSGLTSDATLAILDDSIATACDDTAVSRAADGTVVEIVDETVVEIMGETIDETIDETVVETISNRADTITDPSVDERTAGAATTGLEPTIEHRLAQVLAYVMDVDEVAPDCDFFDDLGADSMIMAHFCARLHKQPDLPSVSIKEVYHHRTIRSLAISVAGADSSPDAALTTAPALPTSAPAMPVPTWQYVFCGAMQLLITLGLILIGGVVAAWGYDWIALGNGFLGTYVRAMLFGSGVFAALVVFPIVAKWVLIGRSQPTQFPVWSPAYVRFWLVKLLVRANPIVLFAGTPVFVLYLRALGATIGRRVLILSGQVPVYADLLSIGDDTVVRKDSSLSCYRAYAGWIQTGPVTVGRDALVGESTVLDIYTSLGDGAQLGHASALVAGQSVPDGEHRQGSPAVRRSDVDYRDVDPAERSDLRRLVYSSVQVVVLFVVSVPAALGTATALAEWRLSPTSFPTSSDPFASWVFYRDAVMISIVLYFGLLVFRFAFVCTVPRLLGRALRPGEVYPLYGIRYWVHRAVTRLTNVRFFTNLFGDSSYIVNYLHLLGYNVTFAEQTGANFGLNVKHDNPYWVTVGPGTMAADGLSIINAEYSSTSFRIAPAVIGAHSFIGNQVAFPSRARTGEDCLLASKVLVPVDGDIKEHVGFLGSPSFEIPRMVDRDREFDDLKHDDGFPARLSAKNRHNIVTMVWFLLSRFVTTLVGVTMALGAVDFYERFGVASIVVAPLLFTLFGTLFNVLVERASTGFQPLRPVYCSLYDPDNWRIERFWKLSWQPSIFNGTPLKSVYWRLMGVTIGKRVFDDGCLMIEKTMISVGDHCVLNAASVIQPHSQEDGTLKTDHVRIGSGCTLGIASLVHYGVTMHDGATLDANAFLMKGADVPPHAHWGENPAREIRSDTAVEPAATTTSVGASV